MSVIQGILLGILQGIAEFLPISSSGHLAVAQNIFGLDDLPLLFDVFLHLATLAAVCLYFWRKIWELLKCFGRWISRSPKVKENSKDYDVVLAQKDLANRKLIIAIILSTVVTGVMGILSSKLIPNISIKVTCCGFLVTSLFLILSSVIEKRTSRLAQNSDDKKNPSVSKVQALIIGFMQGIGTLPGFSGFGSTIAGDFFCEAKSHPKNKNLKLDICPFS